MVADIFSSTRFGDFFSSVTPTQEHKLLAVTLNSHNFMIL